MPEITATSVPPKDAIAFWASRVPMSGKEYAALEAEALARAFFVSGLAKGDLLDAVHASLGKALAEGQSFGAWKKGIAAELEKSGWDGANPWRLETIFRTNMQSAYMAGRYQQMKKNVKLRPYWQMSGVNDSRTRPAHAALHGVVYPADDPFWDTYYPPNGFRCRCTVKSLSERQVKERGLTVERTGREGVEHLREHKDFGLVNTMPAQGFDRNVGQDWWAGLTPGPVEGFAEPGKLRVCPKLGKQFAADGCAAPLEPSDPRIKRVTTDMLLPKGLTSAESTRIFLAEFGITDQWDTKLITIPGVDCPLPVNQGFFREKLMLGLGQFKGTWGDKGAYMRLLALTLKEPFEVWRDIVKLPSGERSTLRVLKPFSLDGKIIHGFCGFHLIEGRGWQSATAFAPKAERNQKVITEYFQSLRKGILLYEMEKP